MNNVIQGAIDLINLPFLIIRTGYAWGSALRVRGLMAERLNVIENERLGDVMVNERHGRAETKKRRGW